MGLLANDVRKMNGGAIAEGDGLPRTQPELALWAAIPACRMMRLASRSPDKYAPGTVPGHSRDVASPAKHKSAAAFAEVMGSASML